jgi:hypothetical protein
MVLVLHYSSLVGREQERRIWQTGSANTTALPSLAPDHYAVPEKESATS